MIPAAIYHNVTWSPNIPINKAIAISLISGDVIKKAKVTPNGILASTNQIKSGIDEQEQNGVKAPNTVARK